MLEQILHELIDMAGFTDNRRGELHGLVDTLAEQLAARLSGELAKLASVQDTVPPAGPVGYPSPIQPTQPPAA